MTIYSWPVSADIPVSQGFGTNPGGYNPVGGHTGTDLAAPLNTPVHAPADGVIKHSNFFATTDGSDNPWLLTSWGGITVVLDCGEVLFVFAHLNSTDMNDGQTVRKGDIIGYSGNTGTIPGMGYHLHFEAMPDGWDVYNGTYGRVSPALYCRDYSAVYGPGNAVVGANQRVTGPAGVNGRDKPSTDGAVQKVFGGNLMLDFKGFVRGQSVNGNDIWFVGFSSGLYFHSSAFESQSTDNLPDLTPAPAPSLPTQAPLGYQRITGPNGVTLRDSANKAGAVVKTFDSDLILDFKGFVYGEDPYGTGNNVWFVGKYSNTYVWSGGFTDSGTHDLPDITQYKDTIPSTPPVEKYNFDLDFTTITREDGVVITVEKTPAAIGNLQKGNPTAKHNIGVWHQFGTPGVDTFDSTKNQFEKDGTLVSAYFSVSGRRIRQHVSLKDRAYHAGSVGNDYLGVENDPTQDPETILTSRALAKALKEKEGLKSLVLHKNVPGNNTNCGALIDLSKYQSALDAPVVVPPVVTPPVESPVDDIILHEFADWLIESFKNRDKGK